MLEIAGKILKERGAPLTEGEGYRAPIVRRTAQGYEKTGGESIIDARIVTNPGSTVCLVVDDFMAAGVPPGYLLALDTSDVNAADLSPFENKQILAYNNVDLHRMPPLATMISPVGFLMGWLRFKPVAPAGDLYARSPENRYLVWVATLGAWDDPTPEWKPTDKAPYIGEWYAVPDPRCKSDEEWKDYEIKSRMDAPGKVRLISSCRILGRVIAYYPPLREGGK